LQRPKNLKLTYLYGRNRVLDHGCYRYGLVFKQLSEMAIWMIKQKYQKGLNQYNFNKFQASLNLKMP